MQIKWFVTDVAYVKRCLSFTNTILEAFTCRNVLWLTFAYCHIYSSLLDIMSYESLVIVIGLVAYPIFFNKS